MPFLLSSGSRKKKSYIQNEEDAEESARRREMIKQKLYADHMLGPDENDCDGYLERRVNSRSPIRRGLVRANSNRRVQAPNYIDPSGSLRQTQSNGGNVRAPPRRAYSEQNGRKSPGGVRAVPPLPPRRTNSFRSDSENPLPESPIAPKGNARFSMAPHPNMQRQPRTFQRMSSRKSLQDEEEEEEGEMMLAPASQRRPPPRRRRATVSAQTIEKHADSAMRFGGPRRAQSHYPGSRSPRSVASIGMMDNNLDFSDHSKSSRDCSQKSVRRGIFRHRSGQSDEASECSSTGRSSSFFRKVKRNNTSSLKKSSQMDSSDHTSDSQKSWFTNGSGVRSKEEIYNTALSRAKERQAIKNAQNYLRNNGAGSESIAHHPGRVTLSEQLSRLPPANDDSDDDYEEDDEGAEGKSIFSSIIQKIEDIYDDCS